jgi:hypothetical protein
MNGRIIKRRDVRNGQTHLSTVTYRGVVYREVDVDQLSLDPPEQARMILLQHFLSRPPFKDDEIAPKDFSS